MESGKVTVAAGDSSGEPGMEWKRDFCPSATHEKTLSRVSGSGLSSDGAPTAPKARGSVRDTPNIRGDIQQRMNYCIQYTGHSFWLLLGSGKNSTPLKELPHHAAPLLRGPIEYYWTPQMRFRAFPSKPFIKPEGLQKANPNGIPRKTTPLEIVFRPILPRYLVEYPQYLSV